MADAQIIDMKALARADDGSIIPAQQREHFDNMDQLLATANTVFTEAQTDATTLRERAREEGYAEGKEQASEEMTAALADQHRRGHALFEKQSAMVQEMALAIVERLAPELDAAELVRPMVTRAILAAQADQYLQVKVHPSQAGVAREAIEQLGNVHPAVGSYQVISDENVDALSCVVETEVGAVRASLEQQLAAIRSALFAPLRDDEDDSNDANG
ncbi:MAG: FliH/SctL family protein [Gammaproteobacteria bacterium]